MLARLSPLGNVFRVVLPAAAPQIVAGLRNSLQVAIILMVVSEWEASTDGLGFYIVNAQQSFDYVAMWSRIIVLAIIDTVAEPAVRRRREPRTALALRRACHGRRSR